MIGSGRKRFTALIVTAILTLIGCQSPKAGRTTPISDLRGSVKSVTPMEFTANDNKESYIQPLGSPVQEKPNALTKFLNRFKPKKKRIPLPLSKSIDRPVDAGEGLNAF